MIETFRMLGREREADLAREAQRFQLAARVVPKRRRRRRATLKAIAGGRAHLARLLEAAFLPNHDPRADPTPGRTDPGASRSR